MPNDTIQITVLDADMDDIHPTSVEFLFCAFAPAVLFVVAGVLFLYALLGMALSR